jgi:hypothetical protein
MVEQRAYQRKEMDRIWLQFWDWFHFLNHNPSFLSHIWFMICCIGPVTFTPTLHNFGESHEDWPSAAEEQAVTIDGSMDAPNRKLGKLSSIPKNQKNMEGRTFMNGACFLNRGVHHSDFG